MIANVIASGKNDTNKTILGKVDRAMFTGIIQSLGEIKSLEQTVGDIRLTVQTGGLDIDAAALGDSIAVNGVCLTVIEKTNDSFAADVSVETLNNTSLKQLSVGSKVNLEAALLANAPLGGHIVSGHVDGVGQVQHLHKEARSTRFVIKVPDEIAKYVARKGSICIDGVSLTINAVNGSEFSINIIPHTIVHTLFHEYTQGSAVNLEVDLLARYVERLMLGDKAAEKEPSLTKEFLAEHGFLK